MNRLELANKIKTEGKKRKINITQCNIYDRGDYLEFFTTIKNDTAKGWVYTHQVEELIEDLCPIERKCKIGKVDLEWRKFKIGELAEVDNLWIRLDGGEKEPKSLIKIGSACGQWRSGWVTGKVIETPEQNDRALVVIFNRDVWIEKEHQYWGDVTGLEKGIEEGKIKKIEKGQPVFCGIASWDVRKH